MYAHTAHTTTQRAFWKAASSSPTSSLFFQIILGEPATIYKHFWHLALTYIFIGRRLVPQTDRVGPSF